MIRLHVDRPVPGPAGPSTLQSYVSTSKDLQLLTLESSSMHLCILLLVVLLASSSSRSSTTLESMHILCILPSSIHNGYILASTSSYSIIL